MEKSPKETNSSNNKNIEHVKNHNKTTMLYTKNSCIPHYSYICYIQESRVVSCLGVFSFV